MNRTQRSAMITGALITFSMALPVLAQTAQDVPESTKTLWQHIQSGGPLMIPIFFVSVAVVALSVYGFVFLIPEKKMLTPQLVPPLQDAIDRLDLAEAQRICTATPSLLTNILNAGLERASDGIIDVPSMEKAMEEASVEETAVGLKIISYLSISAQIAPMLGLLGTVTGMISAFELIGKGAMGRPEVLADSIGVAMITTATGLMVGIPAMFLYFYLKGRYTTNVTRMTRILGNLLHRLMNTAAQAETSGTTAPIGDLAEPQR